MLGGRVERLLAHLLERQAVRTDLGGIDPLEGVAGPGRAVVGLGHPGIVGLGSALMQPIDLGRLVSTSSPRVSPDGRLVAYLVTAVDLDGNTYRRRLWLAPSDASTPARPLTDEGVTGHMTWSPDGRLLAYAARAGEGAGATHTLHLLPMDGPGAAVTIATGPEAFVDLAWSPDGRRLAYAQRTRLGEWEPDERRRPPRRITRLWSRLDDVGWTHDRPLHVHVVPVDGSAVPTDLTPGELAFDQPSWLADSSGLVVSGQGHDTWDLDQAYDLYTVTLDGDRRPLTAQTGHYRYPTVSPDGSSVAFLGYDDSRREPANGKVGLLDLATAERRWLTDGYDRTCLPYPGARPPVWDGSELLFAAEDRGRVPILSVSVGAGAPHVVVGGERVIGEWHAAGATIAFTSSTPEQPPEVYSSAGGIERRLSTATSSFVAAVRPRPAERFVAPSGGVEVDAWIVTPADLDASKRYPALLNIHGGPFTQYGHRFFDEVQLQAGAGFVALLSNPRGASGREQSWGRAISGPKADPDPGSGWGSVDYDDVMAVVDEALRRYPFIDPDRLGVLGGSYGGYLTSWIVGHTNRFKAACSERSVNELYSFEWTSDIVGWFATEIGVSYLDDAEEYRRVSPMTYVRDIETPLLVLHSENDLRCPISQAEAMFTALRLLGKEVELHRFPAEGHELSRSGSPVHRRQRIEIILEFFRRHLGAGPR